jgi:hypothetical protein
MLAKIHAACSRECLYRRVHIFRATLALSCLDSFFFIYRLKPAQLIVVLALGILLLFARQRFSTHLQYSDMPAENGQIDTTDRSFRGRASKA